MKARKFWKRFLRVRTLLIGILVIAIAIFAISYFGNTITANTVTIDNMDFTSEGFTDFLTIDESKINNNKVVGKNDKYIMFMDESTTIVTVAEISSLKSGEDPNKASSYTKYVTTANGNEANASAANFNLTYAPTAISETYTNTYDSYRYSVLFNNELTGTKERHYQIKYLTQENDGRDAVQVYYTVGNFSSSSAFFAKRIYSTTYEPDRFMYETEEEYEAAVRTYESEYLTMVGSLDNTFEERYRGNVKTEIKAGTKKTIVVNGETITAQIPEYTNSITVYSQKARDYIINVFYEMNKVINEEEGIMDEDDWEEYYPMFTEDDILEMNEKDGQLGYKTDSEGNHYWKFTINDPKNRLIDYTTEYYKKYFNNSESPLTNNPFMLVTHYQALADRYSRNNMENSIYSYKQMNATTGQIPALYALLYKQTLSYSSITTGNPLYQKDENGEYVPFYSGGYVAKDEEGNAIYDENGLVREYNSKEQVQKDNAIFGITTDGLPAFKIALDFELSSDGLSVTIPTKSLVDSSTIQKDDPEYDTFNVPYYIASIQLLNNMLSIGDELDGVPTEGYMIVPDGSGAVINFNNGKNSTVAASYYGDDQAYVKGTDSEETANLMLGMFAYVNTTPGKESGFLGVVEKGGGQVSLTASTVGGKNTAYFSATLRSNETVKTGTVTDSKSFLKWDKILSPSDIAVKYIFLDKTESDYSTIAKKYQEYLMKRDGLEFKDTTNETVNDLTFIGTYEKYSLFLGIKYKTPDTLTTFDQAIEIVDELSENKVNNIAVTYKGWTNEYLEYEVGGSLKVANVLGKTATMRKFYEYCVEKQIPFYPELSISSTKGYDYIMGSSRYTSRGVANDESIHYTYDLATLRQDKKLSKIYTIAPQYYKNITETILKKYNKLNITNGNNQYSGFYITDLGNQYAGNYRKNQQVYAAESITYQQESLELLKDQGNLKLSAPYDYAFKYVDTAIDVPVSSKMYTVYDYSIPFYQLVVSGLFDYCTEQINGQTSKPSKWYFAKALESGSNLSYILTAEDPAELLETDYTEYYQAYYKNWKNTIISFAQEMDKLGIHQCVLESHEFVADNLAKVTYRNKTTSEKLVLLVNISNTTKVYGGTTLEAYGYAKIS